MRTHTALSSIPSSSSPFLTEQQMEMEARFHHAIMREETRQRVSSDLYSLIEAPAPTSTRESFATYLALALDRRQLLCTYLAVAQDTYSLAQLDSMPLVRIENIYALCCLDFPVAQ